MEILYGARGRSPELRAPEHECTPGTQKKSHQPGEGGRATLEAPGGPWEDGGGLGEPGPDRPAGKLPAPAGLGRGSKGE